MSKTDKTRPLDVRMMDPKDISIGKAEHHNHEKGYCDLPANNVKAVLEAQIAAREAGHPRGGSCFYSWSYRGVNVCGCSMCTESLTRREERRANRHQAKVQMKTQVKEINGYLIEDGVHILELDEVELSESTKAPVSRFAL